MTERLNILLLHSHRMESEASAIATGLELEGITTTVRAMANEFPSELGSPQAVLILGNHTEVQMAQFLCENDIRTTTLPCLTILPSIEQVAFSRNPERLNDAYLTGRIQLNDIQRALKALTEATPPTELIVQKNINDELANTTDPTVETETDDNSGKGQIIVLFGAKGGVGKTAIATNLAVALKERRENRVLLLDGDLQFGSTSIWLNLRPTLSITELLTMSSSIDDMAVRSAVVTHESGLDVLLPPTHPATAEQIRPEVIKTLLNVLRESYDFIVVDTPASYHEDTLAMLDEADHIVVVMTPELSVVRNTVVFLELAKTLGYHDRIMVALNRCDAGIEEDKIPESIRKLIKLRMVSDGRNVVWSENAGKPFVTDNRRLGVSRAIYEFASYITDTEHNSTKKGNIGQPFRAAVAML